MSAVRPGDSTETEMAQTRVWATSDPPYSAGNQFHYEASKEILHLCRINKIPLQLRNWFGRETVKKYWIKQGIWRDEWQWSDQPQWLWRHQEQPEKPRHGTGDALAKETPFARFNNETALIHQQIEKDVVNHPVMSGFPHGTPAEISTRIYSLVKEEWSRRGLWLSCWDDLPGLSWTHKTHQDEIYDRRLKSLNGNEVERGQINPPHVTTANNAQHGNTTAPSPLFGVQYSRVLSKPETPFIESSTSTNSPSMPKTLFGDPGL